MEKKNNNKLLRLKRRSAMFEVTVCCKSYNITSVRMDSVSFTGHTTPSVGMSASHRNVNQLYQKVSDPINMPG